MAENKNSKFITLFNSKRTTFILIAVLLVVVNILAASLFLKLDLTSSKAYTLLSVSKNTISEIGKNKKMNS